MHTPDPPESHQRWFPICGRQDLPARHVFETGLFGRELAVWRGAGGGVNVWENRCPHRGLRFSIGANLGDTLRCAYHGYRFADATGVCTAVPAQPERLPPRSLCARVFPVLESGALVWTRLGDAHPAADPPLGEGIELPLHAVAVRAPAAAVGARLAGYRFRPSAALAEPESEDERCRSTTIDAYGVKAVACRHHLATEVRLFLQPVDSQSTVIHAIVQGEPGEALRLPTLLHHARLLGRLRDACEREVERGGAPSPAAAPP
jgi:nitrite reductase/ring-hydroxylating ferredoxin subunit